jgi:uncharacterized protein involved in exopolysaccharide biosynthesis
MIDADRQDDDEVSLFALGTILLRRRWRIVCWMLIGATVAALSVFSKPKLYVASASFIPQGNDASRSALAGIAGQLGVALPAGTQSSSSDFYSSLLTSRVLLTPITRDTFVVRELGGQRVSFLDLFKIGPGPAAVREEQGVALLMGIVTPTVVRLTGVVELSVATQWPSVSLALATALVNGVDEYNQRMRQGQAGTERRFVEGRLAAARADLREAEDRLERFLATNRQFGNSPELTFQHDRIQRDVMLRQQVFTSLTQAYEDARIREVRDTPVITVFEPPSVPTLPQARGRLKRTLLGLILGGFVGAFMAFVSGLMDRRRKEGNAEADEFVGTLSEVTKGMLDPVRRLMQRTR